jgi:hypothetical protein
MFPLGNVKRLILKTFILEFALKDEQRIPGTYSKYRRRRTLIK